MNLRQCVCITADVIGSRKSNKGIELAMIVSELNKKLKEDIVTKFTIRAGDEIFGVVNEFHKGFDAYKELFSLSKELNVPLYVGVGFGSIFEQNLSDPDLVSGQAIWNSADALDFLKNGSKKDKYKALNTNSLDESFRFHFILGKDTESYRAVNYLLFFIMERVIKRTNKQRKAVNILENNLDKNYNQLGEYLGYENENTREANFQKLLRRGDYFLVKEAELSLVDLIREIYDQRQKDLEK
ncbi:SatD family protein [Halobacillus mangrovi]|uniref:SatD family protein n=1 Tax=Halobacillus mangrovi TaxID=402384 RepID=UPI003D95CACF